MIKLLKNKKKKKIIIPLNLYLINLFFCIEKLYLLYLLSKTFIKRKEKKELNGNWDIIGIFFYYYNISNTTLSQ